MDMSLTDLLDLAYHKHQVMGDRPGAVDGLRTGLADSAFRDAAEAERTRLAEIVRARSRGDGECGCHISKIHLDLLNEALGASDE